MDTSRAYVTLCIYSNILTCDLISNLMQIKPDRVMLKGKKLHSQRISEYNGWFFGTQNKVDSDDLAIHIQWILINLKDKHRIIHNLKSKGCEIRMMCFYESIDGNGGPFFDYNLIQELATMPIDLEFDIWFAEDAWFRTDNVPNTE